MYLTNHFFCYVHCKILSTKDKHKVTTRNTTDHKQFRHLFVMSPRRGNKMTPPSEQIRRKQFSRIVAIIASFLYPTLEKFASSSVGTWLCVIHWKYIHNLNPCPYIVDIDSRHLYIIPYRNKTNIICMLEDCLIYYDW